MGDARVAPTPTLGENANNDLALTYALRQIADTKGVRVAQLAIAWLLAQGHDIVPLIGARRRDQLAEAVGGLQVNLTWEDLAAIERAAPRRAPAGDPQGAGIPAPAGLVTSNRRK